MEWFDVWLSDDSGEWAIWDSHLGRKTALPTKARKVADGYEAYVHGRIQPVHFDTLHSATDKPDWKRDGF
jgi:hypothetical protein